MGYFRFTATRSGITGTNYITSHVVTRHEHIAEVRAHCGQFLGYLSVSCQRPAHRLSSPRRMTLLTFDAHGAPRLLQRGQVFPGGRQRPRGKVGIFPRNQGQLRSLDWNSLKRNPHRRAGIQSLGSSLPCMLGPLDSTETISLVTLGILGVGVARHRGWVRNG